MSKSTYKQPAQMKRRGPSAFVRITSIVLAGLVIVSIIGNLAVRF